MTYNRILTDADRAVLAPTIKHMFEKCPDMMSRKISEANVQQAFVLSTVKELILKLGLKRMNILSVGSFEDTACATLKADGVEVEEIDPDVNGLDLHKFFVNTDQKFDIIFSTSVLEHVKNDEQFIEEICQLLTPGGWAVLTTDFKNDYVRGDPLPYSDERFYTKKDLEFRIVPILVRNSCDLVDVPDWTGKDNFVYQGHQYSFATLVFRRLYDVR